MIATVDRALHPFQDVVVTYGETTVKLRAFRDDHITNFLAMGSFYEKELLKFILDEYGRGGVYVDIGAFIGNHTAFFATLCRADHVIAVEPSPASFKLLQHNVSTLRLSRVELHNVATGDRDGYVQVLPPPPGNRGMTAVDAASDGTIKIVRADSLISMPPKLIKIDTEGWGVRTLHGAVQTIREHHPVVVIEPKPEPVELVSEFLGTYGYRCRCVFERTPTYVFD